MGCEYCYATSSQHLAIKNNKKHNPNFPSLIEFSIPESIKILIKEFKRKRKLTDSQLSINF